MCSPGTDTDRIRLARSRRPGPQRYRRIRIDGSVVDVVYDDAEGAPGWRERGLERELRRMFPEGCGVHLVVEVAWSDADEAWLIPRARVTLGLGGRADTTASLIESLRFAGLPVVPGGSGSG